MSEFVHIPVLADEVIELLAIKPGGLYVDGTLGGAGHTQRILDAAEGTRVIGLDRDEDALAAARSRLAPYGDRVRTVHSRFSAMPEVLASLGVEGVDGILLDIGPSSPQFDRAERGFSFSKSGPIDMRMDPSSGDTALDLIRHSSPQELADILRDYGEERYSKRIAAFIKDAYREGNLETTLDLAHVVDSAIPAPAKRKMNIHPATRTFQALRIAVNHELEELDTFLDGFPDLLLPDGRCVVISFHSLEDRKVKRRFRDLAWSSSLPPDLARAAGERVHPVCKVVTRKPVFGTDAEIAANPRARSARVRACQKCPQESL